MGKPIQCRHCGGTDLRKYPGCAEIQQVDPITKEPVDEKIYYYYWYECWDCGHMIYVEVDGLKVN